MSRRNISNKNISNNTTDKDDAAQDEQHHNGEEVEDDGENHEEEAMDSVPSPSRPTTQARQYTISKMHRVNESVRGLFPIVSYPCD